MCLEVYVSLYYVIATAGIVARGTFLLQNNLQQKRSVTHYKMEKYSCNLKNLIGTIISKKWMHQN